MRKLTDARVELIDALVAEADIGGFAGRIGLSLEVPVVASRKPWLRKYCLFSDVSHPIEITRRNTNGTVP